MSNSIRKNTHIMVAKVDNDIIEDAEYFTVNEKFQAGFSDKFSDILLISYWKLSGLFWKIYRKMRYGLQRMIRGYDSFDVIELYNGFTNRYIKIFTDFRNKSFSYPASMTKEEWDNILDKMIYHLRYMNEDNVDAELSIGLPEDWMPTMKTVNKIMEKHKNEFFKLFSKYFYDLWD